MLAELPFVSADEIAAEYKPGAAVTKKSAIRTLSEKGAISPGIDARVRGEGGRLGGSLHLYSAINLDAVRLYRQGDDVAAARAVRRAAQVERVTEKADLAQSIADSYVRHDHNLQLAIAAIIVGAAGAALLDVVTRTTKEREAISRRSGWESASFAWIRQFDESITNLQLSHQDTLWPLPTADLAPTIEQREGAAVALRWQRIAPGKTLLTTAPAIELDGQMNPYEPPLPSEASRVDITGALAAGPTGRRPPRIKVTG